MYQTIDTLNLKDRRVFIRFDLNAPLKNGKIVDDTRLRESLPTLQYALKQGAKVVIGSHLGRPKGKIDEKLSLLPVAKYFSEQLGIEVLFPEDCVGDGIKKLSHELRPGQVLLLENLRFHPEEEANDPRFAEQLASLADVYVSDAFGVVHRAHASTEGMVKFFKERAIGFLIQKELSYLQKLIDNPEKPFVAILGGAKVSDKIGVIENLMHHVSAFIIGGGMAYTFLKAQNYSIGKSLCDDSKLRSAKHILESAKIKGVEILLPVDSILAPEFAEGVETRIGKNGEDWGDWMGLDIGPESINLFSKKIRESKTIFWNGPMGAFEVNGFHKGTYDLALAVAEAKGTTVIGGGDSVSAIRLAGYGDRVTHLCTGGGAALEYLEGKKLPGLAILQSY